MKKGQVDPCSPSPFPVEDTAATSPKYTFGSGVSYFSAKLWRNTEFRCLEIPGKWLAPWVELHHSWLFTKALHQGVLKMEGSKWVQTQWLFYVGPKCGIGFSNFVTCGLWLLAWAQEHFSLPPKLTVKKRGHSDWFWGGAIHLLHNWMWAYRYKDTMARPQPQLYQWPLSNPSTK